MSTTVKVSITRSAPKTTSEVARIGISIDGYTRYPITGVRLMPSKNVDGNPWLAMPWGNGDKLVALEKKLESEIQEICLTLKEGDSAELEYKLTDNPTEWVYVNPFKSTNAAKAMATVTVKGLLTLKGCKVLEKQDGGYTVVGPQYKMGDSYHNYLIPTGAFQERINSKGAMGYKLKLEEQAKIKDEAATPEAATTTA